MAIHVAGPVGIDRVQRCEVCGMALADQRRVGVDMVSEDERYTDVRTPYPIGASVHVEADLGLQSMVLGARPDCEVQT